MLLRNYILLFFKLYTYNSCEKHMLNINNLLNNTAKVKKLGENIASNN